MSSQHEMGNEELLSAYLDGECTDEERAQVEDQLAASPELQQLLAEVEETRLSLRALPSIDGPPEFWAHLLDGPGLDAAPVSESAAPVAEPVVDLAARRTSRVPRWVMAAGGAAAAAVIAVVVLVPQPQSVSPPVGTFTDAHNVRSSLDTDAVSSLVPLGLQGGFRR